MGLQICNVILTCENIYTQYIHKLQICTIHFQQMQGKASQLYLYSAFHTQWQLNALYIKQTFNSKN